MSDQEKMNTSPKKDEAEVEVADDGEESSECTSSHKVLVDQIMQDPSVLASLQQRLNKFLGHPSGYIESLPKAMKKRLKALKKLQLEFTEKEVEFYMEVHKLEVKYDAMHQSLYDKRRAILTGEHEPTEEECDFTLDDSEDEGDEKEDKKSTEELSEDLREKVKMNEGEEEEKKTHSFTEDTKGIPEFWLTIFKNVDLLAEMLQDHDEPILTHLEDVKLKFHEEPMAFTLEFHFSENEFFSNKVLTKYYEMKCTPEQDDPFKFEGPEIVKCKGCTIDWKQDKNVTIKTIKKKQKHKTRGAVRTITKTVPRDSFFNFFNPPEVPEEGENEGMIDEQTQTLLTADFEIGHYIRERVVPRAVLFFTGEALDDEFEEEEGDDEDDLEEEEEDDPDYDPSKDKEKQQECKQQ